MKFLLRELMFGFLMAAGCLLLLHVINVVEWSEVYLWFWYGLKKCFPSYSDATLRFGLLLFASVAFLLFLSVVIYFLKKIPIASWRIRFIQFVILLSLFFVVEIYLQWQGWFPGSIFRNFKIVSELKEEEFQFSDSSGIIRYVNNPLYFPSDYFINKDGFRSKYEYDSLSVDSLKKRGKKIFIFIGDSFVAGLSAQPIANCFADLFDSENIGSLNFGQLGADPLQYALVCSSYVQKLKPDKVIVCIYENDFLTYQRKPSPGIPVYYRTNTSPNGGMLLTQKPLEFGYSANELFNNPTEAYEFYLEHYTIRGNKNPVIRFCSYSSLLTQLYVKFIGTTSAPVKKTLIGKIGDAAVRKILFENLKAIKSVCATEKVSVIFCGIPSVGQLTYENTITLRGDNDSLQIFYPDSFSKEDFSTSQGDIHFNNGGHKKYFEFLKLKLDKN